MENSVENPQKLKIKLAHDPAIPLLVYIQKLKSVCQRETCVLKFITALFTIVKAGNQPKSPLSHVIMECDSTLKRKRISVICSNVNRTAGHYVKRGKPHRKTSIV